MAFDPDPMFLARGVAPRTTPRAKNMGQKAARASGEPAPQAPDASVVGLPFPESRGPRKSAGTRSRPPHSATVHAQYASSVSMSA